MPGLLFADKSASAAQEVPTQKTVPALKIVPASPTHVLAISLTGELLLFDAKADSFKLLDRITLLKDEKGCYSHPALVGHNLFLRGDDSVYSIDLRAAKD
jgi:hypothetical protein